MTKKIYSIHAAKTSLSKLIQQVLRGEKVVIAKRNIPLVELTRINPASKVKLGRFKGQVQIAKDFDAPLADFSEYEK